jgi:hypothetical protein
MRVAEVGASMAWQLEQVVGSDISVSVHGCTARLRGQVPSEAARQTVLDITAELAPWLNVIDELQLNSGSSARDSLPEDESLLGAVVSPSTRTPAETVVDQVPGDPDVVDLLESTASKDTSGMDAAMNTSFRKITVPLRRRPLE